MADNAPASSVRDFFTGRQWRGRSYLISPFMDFMMSGGLAIIVFSSLFFLFPTYAPDYANKKLSVMLVMSWLAFLINDPHFLSSYQIMYRDYGKKLRRFEGNRDLWLRYIIAGIAVPLILTGYFAYAVAVQNMKLFAYATQAMLVIVVWHYTKQGFGVFMMLSAMKKIYYTRRQRQFLLANSYIALACYIIGLLSNPIRNDKDVLDLGVNYAHAIYLHLPAWVNDVTAIAFTGSALLAVMVIMWDKPRPSLTGLVAYLSMYYMVFGASFHPLWVAIYPAFHSLQYLMFVYAYKRGEAQVSAASHTQPAAQSPRLFLSIAIVLGVLFFWAVPGALEVLINPHNTLVFPMTLAFTLFINIHHYFIDNVIWRKEHTEISQYLFYRNTPQPAT